MKARIKTASDAYIRSKCDEKIRNYYHAGAPQEVSERLERELRYIKETDCADMFRIYYEFNEVAKKGNSIITTGASTGNSLVSFLLGNTPIDPMNAYYYCDKCGHFEWIPDVVYGIDSLDKNCPRCGNSLDKRGYSLPEVLTWGLDNALRQRDFIYGYEKRMEEFLINKLRELYSSNTIVLCVDGIYEDGHIVHKISGFAVLPDEKDIDDYPELLTYTDNGDKVLAAEFHKFNERDILVIPVYEDEIIKRIGEMQEKSGVYYRDIDISLSNATKRSIMNTGLLSENEDISFQQNDAYSVFAMAELFAVAGDTYSMFGDDVDFADLDMIYANAFRKDMFELPIEKRFFTRDRAYEILLSLGVEYDSAYKIVEFVRKGKVHAFRAKWDEMCCQYHLPEEFIRFCDGYRYMCSRIDKLMKYYLLTICVWYMENYTERYFSCRLHAC